PFAVEQHAERDGRDLLLHQPQDRRQGEMVCPGRRDRGVPVPGEEAVSLLRPLNPRARVDEGGEQWHYPDSEPTLPSTGRPSTTSNAPSSASGLRPPRLSTGANPRGREGARTVW